MNKKCCGSSTCQTSCASLNEVGSEESDDERFDMCISSHAYGLAQRAISLRFAPFARKRLRAHCPSLSRAAAIKHNKASYILPESQGGASPRPIPLLDPPLPLYLAGPRQLEPAKLPRLWVAIRLRATTNSHESHNCRFA